MKVDVTVGKVANILVAGKFFKDKGLIAYIPDILIIKTGVIHNTEPSILTITNS